jgi:hypothetical protein
MSYDNSLGKRKSRNRILGEVIESYFFLYFLRKATLHKISSQTYLEIVVVLGLLWDTLDLVLCLGQRFN